MPKRRDPPLRLKLAIYLRQNGRCELTGVRLPSVHHCEFHHDPPLGLRPVLDDDSDWSPGQHDPNHLYAVCPAAHTVATNGPDVEKAHLLRGDSDKARIAKTKRLRAKHVEGVERVKRKIPSRPWPRRNKRKR
jgi:hypothetical protein